MWSTVVSTPRVRPRYGRARRATFSRSSIVRSWSQHIATICCASTSSGFSGSRIDSIAPRCIWIAVTVHSSRSPRNLGNIRPRLSSPTAWPARPTRCRPRTAEPGASTSRTRSTLPMSIPSSSELVATMQRRRPALRDSSISRRCSWEMLPWWARTSGAISASSAAPSASPSTPTARSFNRWASRSQRERLLTKTIVDLWFLTASRMRG